jgi:ParB/RepB/Spo0J family partition protein
MELGTHESRAIPLGLLLEPEDASRSEMDDAKLAELADDIRARGVIQHLIVYPEGDRYRIRAGHRRSIAARMAGLMVVPCDVYPTADAADDGMQFAENEYRERLSPADEAEWLDRRLTTKHGGDVDALCAALKLTRARVERRLDLIYRGHEDVFRALQQKRIIVGVAEHLNKCHDDGHRAYLLDKAQVEEWTVARAKGALDEWRLVHAPARAGAEPIAAGEPAPLPINDYFRCRLCGENHNAQNMRPIQMHDYCIQAVLDPALKFHARRGELVAMPRTLDEAVEMVNELIERFPALAGDPAPAGTNARS